MVWDWLPSTWCVYWSRWTQLCCSSHWGSWLWGGRGVANTASDGNLSGKGWAILTRSCINGETLCSWFVVVIVKLLLLKYCCCCCCCHYCCHRNAIKSTLILLPLLGVTWIFGLLAISSTTTVFAWLFTVFNSLQVIPACDVSGAHLHYLTWQPLTGTVHILVPCAQEQKGGYITYHGYYNSHILRNIVIIQILSWLKSVLPSCTKCTYKPMKRERSSSPSTQNLDIEFSKYVKTHACSLSHDIPLHTAGQHTSSGIVVQNLHAV